MIDTEPYCGIKKVPNGRKRGTMLECAETKRVGYWGIKKVDPRVIEHAKKKKGVDKIKQLEKIRVIQVSLRGKINRLTKEHNSEKSLEKKKLLRKEVEELHKELNKANERALELEKKRDKDKVIPVEEVKVIKKPRKLSDAELESIRILKSYPLIKANEDLKKRQQDFNLSNFNRQIKANLDKINNIKLLKEIENKVKQVISIDEKYLDELHKKIKVIDTNIKKLEQQEKEILSNSKFTKQKKTLRTNKLIKEINDLIKEKSVLVKEYNKLGLKYKRKKLLI